MSTELPYSIVVAAKNEEATLGDVLAGVRPLTDDLIVIDGHSHDSTVDIARAAEARVVLDHGLGKGDAVRIGLEVARHPIVVFIDADGSHDPADVPRLVAPIRDGRADLVLGSRLLGGSDEFLGSLEELVRLVGSVLITLCINLRYKVRFTDYQNGLRAIRTDVGRRLRLRSTLTTIEQEMAMRCLRFGFRVIEIATHERRRMGGVSKINVFRHFPYYLWNLFREVFTFWGAPLPPPVQRDVDTTQNQA